MRALLNESNQVVGIGLIESDTALELPEHLPSNFINEFTLYDAVVVDGQISRFIKARQPESNVITDLAQDWQSYADYKQAREAMRSAVDERGGYAGLTAQERKIAAQWYLLTDAQIMTELTLEEEIAASMVHNLNSSKSRDRRWFYLFNFFKTALNTPDALKVFNKVQQYGLENKYRTLGYEGKGVFNYKNEEDTESILDFFRGTAGTSFATDNLDTLNLKPKRNLSVAELKQMAINIIVNG